MILTPENVISVGAFLKEKREKMGLKVYPLSYRTGLAPATIHYAEKERNAPTLGTLVVLAEALGC